MEATRKLGINLFNTFIKSKSDHLFEEQLFHYSNNNVNKYLEKAKYLFELFNPKSTQYNKIFVSKLKK